MKQQEKMNVGKMKLAPGSSGQTLRGLTDIQLVSLKKRQKRRKKTI